MKVYRIDTPVYTVSLEPNELEAFEKDLQCPVDWPIKDVASLIKYVLERHVEYCQARFKL